MALVNPGKPAAGDDVAAEEILGNFNGLDLRTSTLESVIDNLTVDAKTYGNGVFPDGYSASQVSTELQYSSGGFVNSHLYFYKASDSVDFSGKASDTYYVEADSAGDLSIFTSTSTARTNFNTVVWNGSGFTSVTTADRNELATYQEIIDARGSFDTLEDRLDANDTAVGLNTTHRSSDGKNHADVVQNTADIDDIEDGTTVIPVAMKSQSASTLTVDNTMHTIVCDCTSADITITLPAVSTYPGYKFEFYVLTGANDVIINTNAADTLDGTNSTATLTLDDKFTIRGLGSNRWLILDSTGAVLS